VLAATVPLGHRQVVLERGIRLFECVLELVAFEDHVAGLGGLAIAQLRIDDPPDRPERSGPAFDPDQDPLLVPGIVDPVEQPLREPATVGRGLHSPDYTIVLVAQLGIRNPFSFLFARSSKEEQVVAYITREHRRGRRLTEILEDRYVQNRLTPQQQLRLLERPEVVKALGEQDIDAARETLASS
jgi:hypothetical protein